MTKSEPDCSRFRSWKLLKKFFLFGVRQLKPRRLKAILRLVFWNGRWFYHKFIDSLPSFTSLFVKSQVWSMRFTSFLMGYMQLLLVLFGIPAIQELIGTDRPKVAKIMVPESAKKICLYWCQGFDIIKSACCHGIDKEKIFCPNRCQRPWFFSLQPWFIAKVIWLNLLRADG